MNEEETPDQVKQSVLAHNMHLQFWELIKTNLDQGEELDNYDQMGCVIIAITRVLHGLTAVIKEGTEKDFQFKDMLETIEGMHEQLMKERET